MTIKRAIHGTLVDIELTPEEIRLASYEYEHQCRREDVLSLYDVPEGELDSVARAVTDLLSYSDCYFESYWEAVRCVCKNRFPKLKD